MINSVLNSYLKKKFTGKFFIDTPNNVLEFYDINRAIGETIEDKKKKNHSIFFILDILTSDIQELFPKENRVHPHTGTGKFLKPVHVVTIENPTHKPESPNVIISLFYVITVDNYDIKLSWYLYINDQLVSFSFEYTTKISISQRYMDTKISNMKISISQRYKDVNFSNLLVSSPIIYYWK